MNTAVEPLRHYQEEALRWLLRRGGTGLLALAPGLGKTRISLEALRAFGFGYNLVVAPKVAIPVWVREAARWWPEVPVTVYGGTPKQRPGRWDEFVEQGGILLTNHYWLPELRARSNKWGAVVYDESHLLRNRHASWFKEAKRCFARCTILLSGSPIVNGVGDLWPQLHLLDRKTFSSYWRFLEGVCLLEEDGWGGTHFVGLKDPAGFQKDMESYMLRMTREQVLTELPPKVRQAVPVQLSGYQRTLYDALVREMMTDLGDGSFVFTPNVMAQITRLRQIVVSPALIGGRNDSAILAALAESVARDYEAGIPVLVCTPFAKAFPFIEEALAPLGKVYQLLGGLSTREFGARVSAFQEDPHPNRALVVTIGVATSFTATAAGSVYFLGADWTPAANLQAEDRTHRLGQTKSVTVRYMVGEGTIDGHVLSILNEKHTWADLALNPTSLLLGRNGTGPAFV